MCSVVPEAYDQFIISSKHRVYIQNEYSVVRYRLTGTYAVQTNELYQLASVAFCLLVAWVSSISLSFCFITEYSSGDTCTSTGTCHFVQMHQVKPHK